MASVIFCLYVGPTASCSCSESLPQSIPQLPVILVALTDCKTESIVSNLSRQHQQNHFMSSCLPACLMLSNLWCGEWSARDSSGADAMNANERCLLGMCLQEVAAQLAASVLSCDIKLWHCATEILQSKLKGGAVLVMVLEALFWNSVKFFNYFYCFSRLSPLRQIHFSPVQTY